MAEFSIKPDHAVTDESALRGLYPPTHTLATIKVLPALDAHATDFIRRAPFLCIGTQGPNGADVSPRGDPAGFVQVLDPQTLAIPDRPGNNRLDTLSNILVNPTVGILFIIPGFDDTLRINGQASLSTDPDLLQTMTIHHKVPTLAIVVRVTEVFLHCAKAFRRAHMWDPAGLQNRKDMPSLMAMILDQTTGAPKDAVEMQRLDAGLEEDYRSSMY
jgi:PPOX class probable FMN-dependent enzyme